MKEIFILFILLLFLGIVITLSKPKQTIVNKTLDKTEFCYNHTMYVNFNNGPAPLFGTNGLAITCKE